MHSRNPPLIGWRLLALLYDLLPALGLWFLVAALFTAVHGDAIRGGPWGWLELAALWLVTGLYASLSWRRGGQTLGMRPWRLHLVASDGHTPPRWPALWRRYAVGTLSLLAGGLGFWWAWIDRAGLTWHDRASGTHLQRRPKTT
ncbi:MAG: RDD family protein [Thermomonas hydrothermalis]|uniref:RDD family protein n=1 Tax=Thermomonas hydrothermalis TaxID=213588 RepID=UPI00235324B8|nr:RDD family protein [Thermomonas hydrothermalis]MCL6619517.1 RDD family protein [Thermomonas hydrothermalis]